MNARYVIDVVGELASADFSAMPNLMFLGALRKELLDRNFTVESAETIVSQMTVELAPGSMDESECDELALVFAQVIDKMRDALISKGFQDPTKAICQMASKMNVKLG